MERSASAYNNWIGNTQKLFFKAASFADLSLATLVLGWGSLGLAVRLYRLIARSCLDSSQVR